MNILLFLLFSLSCIKTNNSVESISSLVKAGIGFMSTDNCAKTLEIYLDNSKCHNFHVVERGQYDYFIKCAGYFPQDENYWNKNTFRLSYIQLKYNIADQSTIDSHTICTDETWRIEVY